MDAIKWNMNMSDIAAGAIVGAVAGHFVLEGKKYQKGAMMGAITVFLLPTARTFTKGLTQKSA